MLVKIHRLRDKGEKLPNDVARRLHFSGILSFGRVDTENRAQVTSEASGELIAVLFKAKVSRIDHAGLLIRGMEPDQDGGEYRQDWWCLVA